MYCYVVSANKVITINIKTFELELEIGHHCTNDLTKDELDLKKMVF